MSGLDWQLMPINFNQGLDLKTDPKAVAPGYLLRLENGIFTKGNIISKRFGVDALGNTVFNSGSLTISSGSAYATFQNELLAFDGNHVFSRFETNDSFLDRGQLSSVQIENQQIFKTNSDVQRATATVNQNIEVHCRYDGTNVFADIIDSQTKSQIVSGFLINSGVACQGVFQTIVIGNYIYVVLASGANIFLYQLLIQNPSFNRSTAVTDLDSSNQLMSVKRVSNNGDNGIILSYRKSGGTIQVLYINSFGSTIASHNISESPDTALATLTDGSNQFAVAWQNNANGIRIQGFNTSFTNFFNTTSIDQSVVTGSSSVTNMTGYLLNNQYSVYYTMSSSVTPINDLVRAASISNLGANATSSLFNRSVSLASEAWTYNGRGYVTTVFNTPLQSTYFAYSDQKTLVAKIAPEEAGSVGVKNFLPQISLYQNSSTSASFMYTNLNKVAITISSGTLFTNRGVQRSQFDFGTLNEFSSQQLGKNLHIIGGLLFNYDGKNVSEHGFNVYPEGSTLSGTIFTSSLNNISGSIGSGSVYTAGSPNQFTYFFTYRWTDNQGQIHESAESIGQVLSMTGATNYTSWTIPTLRVTNKLSASIGVYRTTLNTNTAYMLTSLSGVFNDPSVDTVSFVDTYPDSVITNNKFLYTDGGVLSHDAPPSALAITTNKNRIWTILAENPYMLQFSNYFNDNEGISFSLNNQIELDSFGGPATTLASMDNFLIIFKQSSIFYLTGDGPDASGNSQGSDFTTPLLITSDVGCVNAASIVLTTLGLMFQSNKGIYLLEKGNLQLIYIGKLVEPNNVYKITSAVQLADVNQIRFTLLGGPTLLYDYAYNVWGTFTGLYNNISDATLFNGKYCFISPSGKVYRENKNTYQDNFQNVSLIIRTAWLKLAPQMLQSFLKLRRIQVLGSLGSLHKLNVKIRTNYDDAIIDNPSFDASTALNIGSSWGSGIWGSGSWGVADPTGQGNNAPINNVYQFNHNLKNTKAESISVEFDDTSSGSLGSGYSLNELLIEVGQKRGPFKLPGFKKI